MDLLPEFPDLTSPAASEKLLPSALPTREELYALTVQEKNKKVELARLYAREHFSKRMTELAKLGCDIVVLRLPDGFDKNSFVQAFGEDGHCAGINSVRASWLDEYDAHPLIEQEVAMHSYAGYAVSETDRTDMIDVLVVDLRPRPTRKERDNFSHFGRPSLWMRLRRFFCCVPETPYVLEPVMVPTMPVRARGYHH